MSIELPYDISIASPQVQADYLRMIEEGSTERFAEMCALQQAPGLKGTNWNFGVGRGNNQDFDALPHMMRYKYVEAADKAGVSIRNKVYASGLADHACDPHAWVIDKDELKAKAAAKGFTVKDAES